MKKQIERYPHYVFYSDGRIFSLYKNRFLKLGLHRDGYLKVTLCEKNFKKTKQVHRLIVEAFLGEIPKGLQVNHINEIKTDNRITNLCLMTPKENVNWGTAKERSALKQKGKIPVNAIKKTSKKVFQYDLNGNFIRSYASTAEAGRNGFSQAKVSKNCNKKIKQHKGYCFTYNPDEISKMLNLMEQER